MELIYLENQHSNRLIERERSGQVEMANRNWHWQVNPLPSLADGFEQINVTVRAKEDDESALVTVTGLIDQFHCVDGGCN